MKDDVYKLGDTVTIRQWDDMENEYGKAFESIKIPYGFPPSMRYLCGKSGVVRDIKRCGVVMRLEGHSWAFTPGMFESPITIISSNTIERGLSEVTIKLSKQDYFKYLENLDKFSSLKVSHSLLTPYIVKLIDMYYPDSDSTNLRLFKLALRRI